MRGHSRPGLTEVETSQLKTLLRAVFRQEIPCPLSPDTLACIGLQEQTGPLLGTLRGLDASAVHAVLVSVLAERMDDDTSR